MTEAQTPRWSVAPYFIVDDVVATANYYRDKLGFHYDRFWGEPSCFATVRRSGITITRKQPEARGGMHPNRLSTRKILPGTRISGSTTPTYSTKNSSERVSLPRVPSATSPTAAAISISATATATPSASATASERS